MVALAPLVRGSSEWQRGGARVWWR